MTGLPPNETSHLFSWRRSHLDVVCADPFQGILWRWLREFSRKGAREKGRDGIERVLCQPGAHRGANSGWAVLDIHLSLPCISGAVITFIGFWASLVGMVVHGMVDATTWIVGRGAFVPWMVIGAIQALHRHSLQSRLYPAIHKEEPAASHAGVETVHT